MLGVGVKTLRRWESSGQLMLCQRSPGETRYYDIEALLGQQHQELDLTIGYARVSSHDQKKDLETQAQLLSGYCAAKGWQYQIIRDLGSGMNYRKRGLKSLLDMILEARSHV